MLIVSMVFVVPAASAKDQPIRDTSHESAFLVALNAERAHAGVAPLTLNASMTAAAAQWAFEMADGSFLTHAKDIVSGTPSGWTKVGENIGRGHTVTSLTAAFMRSDGHRENLLDPSYTYVGIGVYEHATDGRIYTTHRFAAVPIATPTIEPVRAVPTATSSPVTPRPEPTATPSPAPVPKLDVGAGHQEPLVELPPEVASANGLCNGLVPTIVGEGGDIKGTDGDDVILATSADEVIDAGSGDDVICAGSGQDVVAGGAGDDRIFGEGGDDVLRGSRGEDFIDGGQGNDRIFGGVDSDTLYGRTGDDYIGAFGGDDIAFGSRGDDTIFGGFGKDMLSGGPGNDRIAGLVGDDYITGEEGVDVLSGDAGNDTIHGDSGDDKIKGGNGADDLYGNSGDDQIQGGKADDAMDGGTGEDMCTGNRNHVANVAAECEIVFSAITATTNS